MVWECDCFNVGQFPIFRLGKEDIGDFFDFGPTSLFSYLLELTMKLMLLIMFHIHILTSEDRGANTITFSFLIAF